MDREKKVARPADRVLPASPPEPEVSAHSGDARSRGCIFIALVLGRKEGRRESSMQAVTKISSQSPEEALGRAVAFLDPGFRMTQHDIVTIPADFVREVARMGTSDRDAAPREREAVEAEGQQPGPKASPDPSITPDLDNGG